MPHRYAKSIIRGLAATGILLAVYVVVLALVSGPGFARDQFGRFWPYLISLAIGFGIQAGLSTHLKNLVRDGTVSGKVVAAMGTTSTAAMISCCAYYVANLVPAVGVSAVVAFVGQYQIGLFWAGIALNLVGIAYIASRIIAFTSEHEKI